MPKFSGVLETALYVADLERAADFYENVFGLERMDGDARFRAYAVGGRSVLLLFKQGETDQPVPLPGGVVPPHGGSGRLHIAFSIEKSELPAWVEHLARHGLTIESRARWPPGEESIYLRDPDGHLVELATPGIWSVY